MTQPQSGWLALQKGASTLTFIPHPRFRPDKLPDKLSVTLGMSMRKELRVRQMQMAPGSPRIMPTRLMQTEDGRWKAGPFIAILTSSGSGSFHGNRSNFSDIIRMGRRMGVMVFVVTPEGFRANSPTVRGWLLDSRKLRQRWVHAVLPMPHVVYNRIPTRKAEQQPAVESTLQHLLHSSQIHLFNPGFFDKWTLHLYLERSPELRSLLPETCLWNDPERFRQMAETHKILYLKPVNDKAGNGMIRIRRLQKGYEVIHQKIQDVRHYRYADWKELLRQLPLLTSGRKYVVQQAISLACFQERPFDLRLLVQKDGQGKWRKTGLGIRVAGKDAISTHVPMGGSIADADQVIGTLFSSRSSEVMKIIEETGIRIAAHIEEQVGKNLGEMSMDLGLEQDGRLWFFEANAKPMKFDEPDIRQLSLKRLLQYCLFLSGFQAPARKEV
ncbi:YheC/YheD family endospore coat-associated protein [Salinithrix halophila]|uniref:YheC/YheD family protein n=1 Tax=Salinithrix halophila TaxID=1485204 RepID=A0ABV8JG47_9BACL